MNLNAFRGERNYIHSTSICNHFFEIHKDMTEIEVTLRDWIVRVPAISIYPEPNDKGCVKIQLSKDEEPKNYYIKETTAEVTTKEPFDEGAMDEKLVSLPAESKWPILESSDKGNFSFFDRSICGGKHLIEHTFKPKKKLILSKLSIKSNFKMILKSKIFIKIESHLGEKLYKLSVYNPSFSKLGEMIYYGK